MTKKRIFFCLDSLLKNSFSLQKTESIFDSLFSYDKRDNHFFEKKRENESDKALKIRFDRFIFWEYEAEEAQTISEVLQTLGIGYPFDCGGTGRCGKCLIEVSTDSLDAKEFLFHSVLACQTRIISDLVIKLNDKIISYLFQNSRQKTEWDNLETGVNINRTNPNRVIDVDFCFNNNKTDNSVDKSNDFCLDSSTDSTVRFLSNRSFCLRKNLGVAIDLGTTTLCISLVDLLTKQILISQTRRNPQIDFGRDIISRICFASKNAENLKRLQSLLVEEIVQMIRDLLIHFYLQPFDNDSSVNDDSSNRNSSCKNVSSDVFLSRKTVQKNNRYQSDCQNRGICQDQKKDQSQKECQNQKFYQNEKDSRRQKGCPKSDQPEFVFDRDENVKNVSIDELFAKIAAISVAGNPVMEYIFLGLDPSPMGKSPFLPPIRQFSELSSQKLGFPFDANVFIFPIFGGSVGGDIVAGLLALDEQKNVLNQPDYSVYLDIGTNGEMLLLQPNQNPILATATAAGPAFEGAGIHFGMLGIKGAIESVDFTDPPYWQKNELECLGEQNELDSLNKLNKFDNIFQSNVNRADQSNLSDISQLTDDRRIIKAGQEQNEPKLEQKSYFRVIGQTKPQGICGSGLVDAIAELLKSGIILPNGRFQKKEKLIKQVNFSFPYSHVVSFEGQPSFQFFLNFCLDKPCLNNKFGAKYNNEKQPTQQPKDRSEEQFDEKWTPENLSNAIQAEHSKEQFAETSVLITQKDIRQIQLAVGAIRAGIELLLNQVGKTADDLHQIYLAGGFGNYLRRENILRIGLLPQEMNPDQIIYCGNMSLQGAIAVLFQPELKEKAIQLVQKAETIDLATLPQFQDYFVRSMNFPAF